MSALGVLAAGWSAHVVIGAETFYLLASGRRCEYAALAATIARDTRDSRPWYTPQVHDLVPERSVDVMPKRVRGQQRHESR